MQPDLVERRQTLLPWIAAGAGLLAMYVPTLWTLIETVWSSEAQGHGPIVFGLSVWLMWRKWPDINCGPFSPQALPGTILVVIACLLYVLGRSQEFPLFEVGSVIPALAGVLLLVRGPKQLMAAWFPLFFLMFMVPLPNILIDTVTQPMKMSVSYVAEHLLYWVGYPISRTGVILQIGPYQLLVADACAGLHTLFTLEALGLLYLNVVKHSSAFRNISLAILIVPISFAANVTRVVVLTLITYHFGDEAGQGFLHGFAGFVLFMTALLFIISTDSLLRLSVRSSSKQFQQA